MIIRYMFLCCGSIIYISMLREAKGKAMAVSKEGVEKRILTVSHG